MLRPIRVGLLLVGLSLSSATERVGQTAYRPRDDSGCGYSEIQTGARTLEVTFVGQSSVDAHEGVMRRAAELSLQHGFDQFIIVSREDHPEEVIRKTHIVAHVR